MLCEKFLGKKVICLVALLAVFIFLLLSILNKIFYSSKIPIVTTPDGSGIPIVIAIDDGYIYPAIVSMTSLLCSANEGTFYEIYVLTPDNFSNENEAKLSKLKNIYPYKCSFRFIKMCDAYKGAPLAKQYNEVIYYKLMITSILMKKSRCIYMDVDTVVMKDLGELYNYDLGKDNYLGIAADNVGVLVWDLDLSRKEELGKKFDEYMLVPKNKQKMIESGCPEQQLIRDVCGKRETTLPFKFNVQTFLYTGKPYEEDDWSASCAASKEEWDEAWADPVIIHYADDKPWNDNITDDNERLPVKFEERFWEFAQKNFWDEIHNKYFKGYRSFVQASGRSV